VVAVLAEGTAAESLVASMKIAPPPNLPPRLALQQEVGLLEVSQTNP
jgi:hypothetical protein